MLSALNKVLYDKPLSILIKVMLLLNDNLLLFICCCKVHYGPSTLPSVTPPPLPSPSPRLCTPSQSPLPAPGGSDNRPETIGTGPGSDDAGPGLTNHGQDDGLGRRAGPARGICHSHRLRVEGGRRRDRGCCKVRR